MNIRILRDSIKKFADKQRKENYHIAVFSLILLFFLGILILMSSLFVRFELSWYILIIFLISIPIIILKEIDKRFKNPFLWISILFICLIITIGLIVFNFNLGSKLPIKPLFISKDNISIEMYCNSGILKRDVPTEGDYFYCYGIIQNKNNEFYNISIATIKDVNLKTGDIKTDARFCLGFDTLTSIQRLNPNSNSQCLLITEMGSESLHQKLIKIEFNNDSKVIEVTSIFESFTYTTFNASEYYKRENDKLLLFFSLVVLPFTAFGGIKSLMDIWDRKNRKKCLHCKKSIG